MQLQVELFLEQRVRVSPPQAIAHWEYLVAADLRSPPIGLLLTNTHILAILVLPGLLLEQREII